MEDLKEAMIEFMKIQSEHFEEQRRLDLEYYENQNERLEKMFVQLVLKKIKAMQILFRRIRE